MTIHLYYDDSYLKEFSATVLEQCRHGDHPAVRLDRTAFYPTSGGQPHDTGGLGTARVLAVEEVASEVIHILDSPIESGTTLGRIDWDRRFDHMQQHTGQHILSQAFIQTARAATLSFHLGQEICTIDIDLVNPEEAVMADAEAVATQIVFEDRPVQVLTSRRDELEALGVRKESQREGNIRVIDVQGFDRSPCGGTHVRHTGEIGLIAVLGCERYKGGARVEFVCGGRALKVLRRDHETLKNLGNIFTSHPLEIPRLAEKLHGERATLSRENLRLQREILEFEAINLAEHAPQNQGIAIVRKIFADGDMENLKFLVQRIVARPGTIAILASLQDHATVVVAKNRGLPGDCGAAVKQTCSRLGGKGGGKPELAQAGGIQRGILEAWLQALEACLIPQGNQP